jgi:hypothetical protein
MGVTVAVTRVVCNVAPGNQDITTVDLGGHTPKAAQFILTHAISDGVAAANAVFSYGAATGSTERWVFSVWSQDNVGTTNTGRLFRTDACIVKTDGTNGVVEAQADFVFFIPNGVRINWSNAPASAFLLTVVFYAGSDLLAHAGTFQASGVVNNTVDINTVGFEPDVVHFCSYLNSSAAPQSLTNGWYSIGVAINDGADTQNSWGIFLRDAQLTSQAFATISDIYALVEAGSVGVIWGGEVGSFDANGFSMTSRLSGAAYQVGFLALAFNGAADFWTGIISTPTIVGTQVQGGPGFTPQFIMCGVTQMIAINTWYSDATAGSIGLSTFDEDDEYCNSIQDEDNVGTTDTQSLSDNTAVNLPNDDASAGHVAAFGSFYNDGWIWNFSVTEGTAVQDWALAIGRSATPAPVRLVTPTHHQSLGLSVLAFKPAITSYTVRGTLFDDQIASKMDNLSFEKHADGGWWSAQIVLNARLTDAEMWFEEGLNLNIEIYNPALVRIFRGFVNRVELSAGALSATRGPVLNVANRASVTYTPLLDATTATPIYGNETTTTIAEDADSQARFGIIEKVFASEPGRCLQTRAEQQRDTFLEELKEAKTSEDAGFSASNVTQIVLNVLGYRHRLGTYIHQNTAAAAVAIDTKIQQVLASDPNGLFSTDYTGIEINAFLVDQYENDNRIADDVIRDLVEIGGAVTNNRYLFGIYDDEKAKYAAIPTTAFYQHRIADKFRRIERFGTGELVRPWDVEPGQFLFFPDFLIGRTQPVALRDDPRYLFIESVSFSTPYDVQINGAQLSTIPQLLAKARTLE